MRLATRPDGVGEECEETSSTLMLALMPVEEEPFRIPSAIQTILRTCTTNGLKTEDMVAMVRQHASEAQETLWPPPPAAGESLEFCPVLESPTARKRLKRDKQYGRMSAPMHCEGEEDGAVAENGHQDLLEDSGAKKEEEEDDGLAGTWMPAGDGCCRSSDGRVFFAATEVSVPSKYCHRAFPCFSSLAPCIPIGHVARGKLELSQASCARASFLMELEILSGGCRPCFRATVVAAATGERVARMTHSQPALLLQRVLERLLDDPVPRLSEETTATLFGLDCENVRRELLFGVAMRRQ